MIDWYSNYDEINAELREMARQTTGVVLSTEVNRLYIGSGEDFNLAATFGAPNRLLSHGVTYE